MLTISNRNTKKAKCITFNVRAKTNVVVYKKRESQHCYKYNNLNSFGLFSDGLNHNFLCFID